MVIDPLVVLSLVFGLATMVAYGIQSYMASVLTKKDNAIRIIFWYYLFSSILLAVIALLFFSRRSFLCLMTLRSLCCRS